MFPRPGEPRPRVVPRAEAAQPRAEDVDASAPVDADRREGWTYCVVFGLDDSDETRPWVLIFSSSSLFSSSSSSSSLDPSSSPVMSSSEPGASSARVLPLPLPLDDRLSLSEVRFSCLSVFAKSRLVFALAMSVALIFSATKQQAVQLEVSRSFQLSDGGRVQCRQTFAKIRVLGDGPFGSNDEALLGVE